MVLSGRGLQEAIGLGQAHGALLGKFLAQNKVKQFIPDDLAMVFSSPLRFIRPGITSGGLKIRMKSTPNAREKLTAKERAVLREAKAAMLQADVDKMLDQGYQMIPQGSRLMFRKPRKDSW